MFEDFLVWRDASGRGLLRRHLKLFWVWKRIRCRYNHWVCPEDKLLLLMLLQELLVVSVSISSRRQSLRGSRL